MSNEIPERQANDDPNTQTDHTKTECTVDLLHQADRVTTALVIPGANPVEELKQLDAAYDRAGEPARAAVETIAQSLFRQPEIFANLNFQSSLLSGGSTFFGAVLRRMGELTDENPKLAESAALPVLVRLVEHHRRGGNGDRMNEFVKRVETELAGRLAAGDKLASTQLAKVRYEQSMHQFNQKDFERAISTGEESGQLCSDAGDEYGVLATRGNTASLFRYEWARALGPSDERYDGLLSGGRPVLEADLLRAQELRSHAHDTAERQKYGRVEMNNAFHLMHIADLLGDLDLARRMMDILEGNSVYRSAFDSAYPNDPEYAQAWARAPAEILRRLENKASGNEGAAAPPSAPSV